MTTEKRRIPFEPRVFLAALGLALALSPTAASAAGFFSVSPGSTAPASVDATSQNVPVLFVDLTPNPGPASLGSNVNLNMFGDVPANLLTATLWRDEGADGFSVAFDTPVASAAFNPPNAGFPARATLGTISEPALTGGTTRYYFTVSFNGVPPARKMSFGFQMFTDFSSTMNDLPLPFISSPTVARTVVFAKPSDGGFAIPTGGATRTGGLDTGLFVRSGQRVRTETVPGDQWNVSALTDADGIPATLEGLGSFDRGALVGRIGAGPWQLLGRSSTITATSNGTLFVAANDADYSNNSGFVRSVFSVLPSTTPKRWLGGTLGFETSADINQNWAGGRPFDGEHVVFDSSAYDCDWNLPNMSLASLSVSTAFAGSFRLTQPPYHWSNRLLVEGDATIRGGLFSVGAASATNSNTFGVKGRLVVRDTATFDMSDGSLELGLGAEIRAGAVLRASGDFNVRRAIPSLPWYLRIHQATANVTSSYANLDGLDYLDFIDATFVALDNLSFNSYESSTSPYARFAAGAPRAYIFNNWNGNPSSRSPSVNAVAMPAGSTVTFHGSTGVGGTSFGSPNTADPNGVVLWIPDGGGTPGSISGALSGPGGTYKIYASTSPNGPSSTGLGGGGSYTGPAGGYSITSLRTPSTYYLFALQEGGGVQTPFTPAGGLGYPGLLKSEPMFVPPGGNPAGVNLAALDWGQITGSFVNSSNQAGPVIVETWRGDPNLSTSTRHSRGTAGPGFSILTLSSSPVQVFAFVDANNSGAWDVFEASKTVTGVNVGPSVPTPVGDFAIVGGDAAPGGEVALSTQAVHPGAVGRVGSNALIKARMTASGGAAQFSALRATFQGGLPSAGGISVYADNGDGIFDMMYDMPRGYASIFPSGPSTVTVSFYQPAFLPPGVPKDFFITLDLGGGQLGPGATAGILIEAATSFTLSMGTFSVTPGFPVQTGALPVREAVRANDHATPELQGGSPTGAYFFPGQMISVISTGSWRVGPADAATGPGGAPGTTGLNTVLPSANLGELIGRVEQGANSSSPWVRIGASSAPFASPGDGELRLAMNDFVGAYYDNSGTVLAGFAASGSSVGAISGQVFYSTPVAGTLTVTARMNGTTPMKSTSFGVASSSSYPFWINDLIPGEYDLSVTNSANSDFGVSVQRAYIQAGSTSVLNAVMYQSLGSISGAIAYGGVMGQGDFHVGVATVTDFTGEVQFFGGWDSPAAGGFSIASLPAPATYYLVAYRDGDWNGKPSGPEPLGYYGSAGGGLSTLPSHLTKIVVSDATPVTGINVTLQDMGAIEGMVALQPGATGTIVVETGRGVPGSAGYAPENRLIVPIPVAAAAAGVPYTLHLLRPATGYSVFAFLDKNFDGQPSAGEEQMTALSAVSVPSGGRARFDFALNVLAAPSAPASFSATPAAGDVTFDWNLVPGATGYQLRRADGAVLFSLGSSVSTYLDALPGNTSSQIRSISASNGNGVSAATALTQAVYTLAAVPGNPVPDPVGATSALVSWSGANPPGTVYEVQRSTAFSGAQARVYLGTATAINESLAPDSTYFWKVRARNGSGLFSGFSGEASTMTLPAAGPALSGLLNYAGAQTAGGRGFVIEASTSSTTFYPRASSAALPGALQQPWFLPVPAGAYFVRAFVDVAGNGVLQPGADRGVVGSSVVAGTPVTGVNFTVAVDTVPPGPPAGVVAAPGFNKVTLSWVPPTRNANGTTLIDLAGYAVFRATSPNLPVESFVSLTPVLLSTATASFTDNAPLPGVPNIYVVRARDIGGNQSAPSGAVSGSASSGGSISGQIRSFSAASAGQYRVRLSTMPGPSAPSVAEAALTSYTFTGLPDRVYYLRAFRDTNNNGFQDSLTEPAGTFGGLNQPFPIAIINGNAVSGADATICDRSPLQPPAVFGSLAAAGCPALDKGPGFVTSLYALSVGGGAQGSLGVGTQVNLAVSTATAFATDLILLGPDGNVAARDNRVGGANLTATLSAPGIYLAELTSFQSGVVGPFQLNMRLEGGFAGVISGSVTYTGASAGLFYTQVYNSPSAQSVPILTSTSNAAPPLSFGFPGLPDGAYFLRGFRDSNGNGVRDRGEPSGQYGFSASSPTPVVVLGGQASGAPFSVALADPAVGTARGAVLYEGTVVGDLRVEAGVPNCTGCSSIGEVIAFTTVAAGGEYTLAFLPSATDYVIRAFVDANGNGRSDALESSVSTFPITVFVNATSTVSLIVQDGGFGAQGTAVVAGSVTYSGSAAGPVVLGISRDPYFRSVDYLLTLSATGYFQRAGLQGDTTYYMAGFIDTNLNNSPDEALGEPIAPGVPAGFGGTPDLNNPPQIFVAATGTTEIELSLADPPNGSLRGVVSYAGSAASQKLIVRAFPENGTGYDQQTEQAITRVVGVSTYPFRLDFLAAGSYHVSAFVDANGNGWHDFGEPFGSRPPVSVSSGAGSYPSYGSDLQINDPGSFGAGQTSGRIRGHMTYLGTQAGPLYVRFFNNPEFLGSPLYTLRVPATGTPAPGSGDFEFDRQGLPFGTYYLDAFRDPSGSGVYNPAAHAYAELNEGGAVTVSQERPERNTHGGLISDPGQGGSVNAFTGSFAAPGGARFDGGATDLGVIVQIDSAAVNGPQPILITITAQNEGLEAWGVRYSSTGVMLSSAVVSTGDLAIGQFAVAPGFVFMGGRIEDDMGASTATLTKYDAAFAAQDYMEYPGYQGLDGLAYAGGNIYAASRHIPTNQVRVLKIDPADLSLDLTGSFTPPGTCQYCRSRVQGAALSPDGQTFVVYAVTNKQNDGDSGLHFLLKFNASTLALVSSLDITALGAPSDNEASMVLDDAGGLYLAYATDGNTARTVRYDVSGAAISQTASASFGPILVHITGGLGNLGVDPASGHLFEVWESTTGAGDYLLLRYDQSLNLVGQRTFDGLNNTFEDMGFSLAVYNSSTVFVTGSVHNGQNLDAATVRLNGNVSGAATGAGEAVAITTANAVNFIGGTVAYAGSLVTSGTVRMSLTPLYSDVPIRFATAPFSASSPFLFNNVPDGLYDVRAFIDPNGNFNPDEGEPTGASTLYGLEFYRETGSQVLSDPIQLCDRRQISFGADVVQSFAASDCTSPDRPGAPRRLYTFRGTRGQPVSIALKAVGFYDSYLDLYGPDGDWLEYDDDGGGDGNAQISNFVLPEDGVYTIDAGAYASGSFGQFKLSLSGSAGALGGITGSVNYAGSQGGAVIVGLFDSPSFSSSTSVGGLTLTSTRAFAFSNLPVGTTYYLGAFIDANANRAPDFGEDSGVFGLDGVPSPVLLAPGQVASGVEIGVVPSTTAAASAAYVTGVASYAGTRTGALVLEFWSSAQFTGHPVASRVVPTGAGSYDVAVAGGLPYYIRAFIDANGDFALQPDEPRGVYGTSGQGAEQVYAPAGQTMVGIDVLLKDPGLTASGAISGEGTAVLTSTFAVSGQTTTIVVTYTAGANGILTGGQIGFTAPPGFPFPTWVTATSTAAGPQAVLYSGPSVFVNMNSGLSLGQTLVFTWSTARASCQVGVATVTVSSLKTTAAAGDLPQPLLLGSPSLAVVPGPARFVQLDAPYFSVKQGELSEVRRLETRDMCGSRAPVAAPLTVDLRSARFDGSAFVADAEVGVTTSPALSTASAVAVNFEVGRSSKSFYVLSASTGFKSLELFYTLGFQNTFYFGVNAMPANALVGVSVSTASNGVALSSAAIGLGANGQPNQIFVNFTLGDAQQPWHVLVSSLPFKSGETPAAVWERWGYGQPGKGEIAWDGRYSPWISGGVRVPNGLYYVRVELGGGGIKDDTVRLSVALPQFAGRAFDPGTVPNPPLSGVRLSVYGPAGYYTAATGADGSYVLPGLGGGAYRMNVARADYVDGTIDLTLDASGAATSFVSRTAGLLVSSNAAGGLDLFIGRAPRLVVVPSLDASVAAAAADQWGNLQIRSSTAASQQSSTIFGPMRLKGGTTTFDDGGQWDPATQQFIAKTLLGFNVPVGTYTVVGDLLGYSRSTGSIYVGPDGARLDLTPFLPKAIISGTVSIPAPAPANGVSVGISAVPLSTSVASAGLSGGTFINAGQTSAAYSISGFDAGAYLLRANTQGLSAVTTGPIVVSGTATVAGVHFSTFGAGASISGTITVVAPNGRRIWVNAWSPGSFNFGSTQVYVNANAASYALNGLDAGATYQLYANIDGQGTDYDLTIPSGGFPISVAAPATQNFTLAPASGVISGLIMLRPGTSDFINVTLTGVTIASLKPNEVGHAFTEIATDLPNFQCWGGVPLVGGSCSGGVSSATFKVFGVNTETMDIRFLHSTTGQSSRQTLSAVNGSTVSLVSDLRGSTFSISGSLINQISDTLFNTNAKIVANAPSIAPQGYPAGLSATIARVTAVRQEIDAYGVAISTVFNPVSSRVGFLDASGGFTIPNCPDGVYIVRTTDLRSCSTCPIVAPSVGRTVTVAGADVSSVTLTVSNGYSVSGTISLHGGLLDARVFELNVLNKRQEVVRSTVAYLGDLSLGQQSGSVDYAFTNLPAGEFYTLTVRGRLFPIKYVGRPLKFPDPALSPAGLQSNLTGQNVSMLRAAYLTGRLKDGGTGELINAANATLLAPNFGITATANPWTEGGFVTAASSISARPIEGDGYFRVGPLVPDVSYDLRLAQTTWDPNFLASGSQNYAPVTISGLKPTPGEIRDVGTVALGQGQSVTGIVRSTTTGLALGNIKVTARPSFGGDESLVVQSFTNPQGAYSLWVSSAVSNQFSLVAAPRDGNQASDGRYYGTVALSNVNLQTQTSANFLLTPLSVVVTGQVVVADAATGGALSYPFGDKRGFPAAAINLHPVGTVPSNPLGDIEATTESGGLFSIPGLSTGLYSLHATSLGYGVYNATVSVIGSSFSIFTGSNTPVAPLTLTRGATATGRILKSDGTSPNSNEVVGIAAANFGAGEFVVGSVESDPVAKTVNAYTVSGFKPGISYNIVLLSGSNGKEVVFPAEGAGVVFGAAESTTTKTINLTYRPARLDCLGTAKALDAARTSFLVQVDCLKPLRQDTAADDDLTTILTVSTFTAAGAALVAPNGAGILNNPSNSSSRRVLTARYTLATNETRFSIRIRAFAAEIDPTTGDNFAIDKVFDFYAGLDSSADGRATNINGGSVGMNPSAQDELLGLDERSRIDLPPGAFAEGSDSLPDSSVVANPTTTVNVSMSKGRDQQLAKALSIAAVGYAPAALEVADVPSAFPDEMWAAMSTYRTQASTTQVGGANPISAFYSIFLPAGIRHQLKERADLTLSYSLAASTSTTDDKIQVYFYNAVLGRFVPETVNRRLDTVNKTITVSVDHFSTFVVLDSTPVATSTVSFGGADIAVANFPNPADCIVHSNIVRNATLFGSGGVHAPFLGTMIRTSIPLSGTPADLKFNIYNVAGEKVRTIEQGQVPAGQTYYTPWNCRNDAGQTVASGVYIGEAIHGGRRKFFKIAIIKGSGL